MTKKSIVVDRLDRCIVCSSYNNIHIHHIFFGAGKRKLSEKYHLVVPLCQKHHNGSNFGVHNKNGHTLDLKLKKLGQQSFEYHYPDLDFLEVFGRNYL